MSRKSATILQIATDAGVSAATVSRVINHPELVRPGTARRVEALLRRAGYPTPRAGERRTKPGRRVLIFNVPNTKNPFYTELIQGAVTAASAHGYYLLVSYQPIHAGTADYFCRMLRQIGACGVILTSLLPQKLLEQIRSVVPLVQCCDYNMESNFPYVTVDDFTAAKNATEYLIASGRRKIGLIDGPMSFKFAQERKRGFLQAMENAGLPVPGSWMVSLPEIDFDMALSATVQILNNETIPNAFLTISDVYAAAAIRGARRYGLRVPEDVMVIGFDNIDMAVMMSPSITTVNMPRHQLGFSAARMLLEQIDNPGTPAKSLLMDTELIIRESTSPEKHAQPPTDAAGPAAKTAAPARADAPGQTGFSG